MSDVEVAWVAGLLEGEGSFTFGPEKTTGVRQIRVTCAMTDRDVIDRLMRTVGGGNYNLEGRKDPRREHAKPLYVWSMGKREDVYKLLVSIRHLMGDRRGEKIDKLLSYMDDNPLVYNKHKEEIPHGTANGYKHYGCRCRECTDAATAKSRRYRAAAKERTRTALDAVS